MSSLILEIKATRLYFKLANPEGKFLITKFEFGGSFGMRLEGDCHEVKVTLNLKLSVTFVVSLEKFFIRFGPLLI
jgi:hypothetical protein